MGFELRLDYCDGPKSIFLDSVLRPIPSLVPSCAERMSLGGLNMYMYSAPNKESRLTNS